MPTIYCRINVILIGLMIFICGRVGSGLRVYLLSYFNFYFFETGKNRELNRSKDLTHFHLFPYLFIFTKSRSGVVSKGK